MTAGACLHVAGDRQVPAGSGPDVENGVEGRRPLEEGLHDVLPVGFSLVGEGSQPVLSARPSWNRRSTGAGHDGATVTGDRQREPGWTRLRSRYEERRS